VSINRIAALFGVTRQRISALLHETGRVGTEG
jgi:plasmid maintenance system antidote protein VapI